MALIYHLRVFSIRQMTHAIDQKLVVISLFGTANAYCSQQNLSEALNCARQTLKIIELIDSRNELHIATNLAILANIHHHSGDDIQALDFAKRALILLECCVPSDSSTLAPLLKNIATLQVCAGLFNDALLNFIRVLHVCGRTLPERHPKRIAIDNNIQRVIEMQQYNDVNSFFHLRKILPKVLLL